MTPLEQIKERLEKLKKETEMCENPCDSCKDAEVHNRAIDTVIQLLPSIIQEVVGETLEAVKKDGQGYVCGACSGGGFNHETQKNCEGCSGTGIERWDFSYVKSKLLTSLKEESK